MKGKKMSGGEVHDMMRKKVSTRGSFKGKSNKLGQGGRAAQLKSQGVPGGVIGNLARAAHAAPGQANYHKKTKKRKASRKEPTIKPGKEGDVEMKKSKKRKGTLGFMDVERKASKKKQAPFMKQEKKMRKSSKKA